MAAPPWTPCWANTPGAAAIAVAAAPVVRMLRLTESIIPASSLLLSAGTLPGSGLFAALRVAERDELLELLLLLGDAVGRELLVAGAGIGGGLLDQLHEVLPDDGNAFFELADRGATVHRRAPVS